MQLIKAKRIVLLLAIIAPLVFFLSVTIFSFSIYDYNLIDGYISFLGSSASPFRVFMNVFGFGLFGVVVTGLGYVLSQSLKKNSLATFACQLFAFIGLLLVLLAFLPTDPSWDATTFAGQAHSIIGNLAFILMPLSIIFFGTAFRNEEDWSKTWPIISYSLAGVTLIASFFLKFVGIFNGLFERVGLGADLLWVMLVSFNLLFLNQRERLKKFVKKLETIYRNI